MQAQLGDILYSNLKSFTAFSRGREVALSEIAMIAGKPRVQRTGEKLDGITLSFMFHASFCNPATELQNLYNAMQSEEVLPFILANGAVLGDFAIESISDTIGKSDALGNPIYLQADVKLKEIPPADRLAAAELDAIKNGFAYIDSTVPRVPIEIAPTAYTAAAQSRSLAVNNAVETDQQVALIQRSPSRAASALAQIKALTAAASIAALEVANRTREVEGELAGAAQIIQDAEDTAAAASAVAASLTAAEAISLNPAYQEATRRMKRTAAVFITIVASRL